MRSFQHSLPGKSSYPAVGIFDAPATEAGINEEWATFLSAPLILAISAYGWDGDYDATDEMDKLLDYLTG